jgi:hypothetical protein
VSTGFYKRRRGILEHLEVGTISLLDLAVHDYLSLKANLVIGGCSFLPAGVCKTSAVAIHATCPSQVNEKAIQRSLAHLENIGWIKRWNVQGKHGNYPILICRASVHDLSGKEYRVNGEETTDWRSPVYVPVGELSLKGERSGHLESTDREEKGKKERKKKTTAPQTGALIELPDWVPRETWSHYVDMRRLMNREMGQIAAKLVIAKLDALRQTGHDPQAVLEQSIMCSWVDVYELHQ